LFLQMQMITIHWYCLSFSCWSQCLRCTMWCVFCHSSVCVTVVLLL